MELAKHIGPNLYKIRVFYVNALCNMLPDDHLSCRIRAFLYNTFLGTKISYRAKLNGGGYLSAGGLTVEAKVSINRGVDFDLTGPITIKRGAAVGQHVRFITAMHAKGPAERRSGTVTPKPIVVEEGAGIATGAHIFPDVTIGKGAVVMTAAVVTRDVKPNIMVAGNPARFALDLNDKAEDFEPDSIVTPLFGTRG